MNKTGLDVSHWQEVVNWQQAKTNGAEYVFIKASEYYTQNVKFKHHWYHAGLVGLPRGAYHYYRDEANPKTQARKFYDFVLETGHMGELPPVLDIEEINNPTLTPWKIRACLEEITILFQRVPLIYTRATVWDPAIGNVAWAQEHPLWVAHYPFFGWFPNLILYVSKYLKPKLPQPWTEYHVWQITDKSPGAPWGVSSKTVDINLSPEEKLAKLLNGGTVPPPEPPGVFMPDFKVLTTTLNIRDKPSIIGNDVGDLHLNDEITALDVEADTPYSVWVKIAEGQWCALVHGGVRYLEHL